MFYKIGKKILKFIWNHKRIQVPRVMLRKKGNAGGTTTPGFMLYDRAMVIKHWSFNIQNSGFQE